MKLLRIVFYRTPPVAAFISTRNGRRGKRGTKEGEKISNERIKKHLLSLLLASFSVSCNKTANTTISI